ncbi:hypothetical protein JB92DRAFT_3292255 [Gautieria morchelliformis]|nr:hypothetical protein JB92DRAFT_3292255 [Gautieria morchelliformis]
MRDVGRRTRNTHPMQLVDVGYMFAASSSGPWADVASRLSTGRWSASVHVRYAPATGRRFMAPRPTPGARACGMPMVYFCATRIAAMRSSFRTSSIIRSASPILQRVATTHMGKRTSGGDARVRVERLSKRREGEEGGVPLMERRGRGVFQRGRWVLGACFGLLEHGGGDGVEEKSGSGSSSCRMGGAAPRASAPPSPAQGTRLVCTRGGWTRGEADPMRCANRGARRGCRLEVEQRGRVRRP